jgi:hypothetical protein
MRKLIFTTACFVLFSLALAEAQIYVGPKIGGSLNLFSTKGEIVDDIYDSKIRIGYTAGITADIPLISGLSIQTEILYTKSQYRFNETNFPNFLISVTSTEAYGTAYDVDLLTGQVTQFSESPSVALSWDRIYNIQSIDIPLLIKYEFLGGSLGYFVEVGPVFSIGIGGNIDGLIKDSGGSQTADSFLRNLSTGIEESRNYEIWLESHDRSNLNPQQIQLLQSQGFTIIPSDIDLEELSFDGGLIAPFRQLNMGFGIGGGTYFETGYGRFYLSIRYVRGMRNFWNESFTSFRPRSLGGSGSDYEAFDTRTNNLQLSVSYAFPLGGGF